MELLNLLLSDWIGRLSLFTVLFCIGMVGYLLVFFIRKAYTETPPSSEQRDQLSPPLT